MKIDAHFRPLPTSADHTCFGYSPVNEAGLQMAFFQNEDAVYSRVTIPAHLGGWNNVAHGGVVTAILIFSPHVAKRLKIADDKTLAWFHGLFAG